MTKEQIAMRMFTEAEKRTYMQDMSLQQIEFATRQMQTEQQDDTVKKQKYNQEVVEYDTKISENTQKLQRLSAFQKMKQQAEKKEEEEKKKQLAWQAMNKTNPVSLLGVSGKTLAAVGTIGWLVNMA